MRARDFVLRLIFIAALLAVWEALVRVLDVPAYLLPTPSAIGRALVRGITSGLYEEHVGVTISETLLGFVVGTLGGLLLGTAVALSRRFDYFIYPIIVMFQAMPKVALAPLIIIWFGLGISSKVVSEFRARLLLPADDQHHRRPALGRGGPRQPDALARRLAAADLLDAAGAECVALHLRRTGDRHDLRADRRHRR